MKPVSEVILDLQDSGSLRGLQLGTAARRFLNIPYALPPIGERRWKKPVPLPGDYVYGHDKLPHDCTKFGPICHQPDHFLGDKNLSEVEGATHSEDCLLLNIWLPANDPPRSQKWPVFAWIHGGSLQMGNPCHKDEAQPVELIAEDGAGMQAIVVAIGYRLNIFGFLAGNEMKGNFGFWDQRCALEWIQRYIHFFGGDKDQVTVGGLSAGAYSSHCQLQYELLHTDGTAPLFRGIFLCSNAIPVQPKLRTEANEQLENVFEVFGVSQALSTLERIEILRTVPAEDFISKMPQLRWHSFRATTDGEIIQEDMMQKLRDGTFARLFKERGYRILIGETEEEQHQYSKINAPDSMETLLVALQNHYPAKVCQRLLAMDRYKPNNETAGELFGRIKADLQVRAPIRAICQSIANAGVPMENIMRYRISFRPKCADRLYPPIMGVTHGVDESVWWFLRRWGYDDDDVAAVKIWLQRSLIALVKGQAVEWGCANIKQYQQLCPDRTTRMLDDVYWDDLINVNRVLEEM